MKQIRPFKGQTRVAYGLGRRWDLGEIMFLPFNSGQLPKSGVVHQVPLCCSI